MTEATQNRITEQDVDAAIAIAQYHHFEFTSTTVCQIILKNGFSVLGSSATVDRNNFDPEIGRRMAHDDAKRKIWELLGFVMKNDLHRALLAKHSTDRAPIAQNSAFS